MRLGELAALKKTDVDDDYIWVHRQQVVVFEDERCRNRQIKDLEYTKNEKENPKGGRLIPITDNCRAALQMANEIPGESEYVFHHPNDKPIVKESNEYYLRRRCKALGIGISHNHVSESHLTRDLSKPVLIVTNAVLFSDIQCRLMKDIILLATDEKWKMSKTSLIGSKPHKIRVFENLKPS